MRPARFRVFESFRNLYFAPYSTRRLLIPHPLFVPQQLNLNLRPFSQSSPLRKKGKKNIEHRSPPQDTSADPEVLLAELNGSIEHITSKLKEDLTAFRVGGRLSPANLEGLRVVVDKSHRQNRKLSDLAQVIPIGNRTIIILAGESAHLKPIQSAIASQLSLNAQPDISNAIQLNVSIPPPTQESRQQAVKDSKATMEKASFMLRNARGATNKKLKDLASKKIIQPDPFAKALNRMEKISQDGQKKIKNILETTLN